jgi:uncharacterized membrane protein
VEAIKLISFAACIISLILAIAIFPNVGAQQADLVIDDSSLSFNPEVGVVGQETVISVGITNSGNASAENVRVDFYVKNVDGSNILIGSWQGGDIPPSETILASIGWTPTNRGIYSIWANAVAANEDQAQWANNNNQDTLVNYEVEEPAWILPAIMASIVIVIVIVILGMRRSMRLSLPTRYPITQEDLWDGEFSEEVLDGSVGIYIPDKIKSRKETEIFIYFENITTKPIENVNINFGGLDMDFRRDGDINKDRIESGESVERTLKITPRSGKGTYRFRITVSGGGLRVDKKFEVRVR